MADKDKTTENFKTYLGARVLWPPECPDNILDAAIEET